MGGLVRFVESILGGDGRCAIMPVAMTSAFVLPFSVFGGCRVPRGCFEGQRELHLLFVLILDSFR